MKRAGIFAVCGFRALLFCSAFLSTVIFSGIKSLSAQETAVFENGKLRRFSDDEGSFFADAVHSRTLRVFDGFFVQKRFDSLSRLVQKSVWNVSQTEPLSVIDYSYEGDTLFPETAVTTDNEKKRIIHEYFTDAGLPVKREIYTITAEIRSDQAVSEKKDEVPETSDTVPAVPEKNLQSKSDTILFCTETFLYDEEKRIIGEIAEYAAFPVIEKKEYRYAKGGSYPDEFYYRNTDKIRQKIYSSAKDWEETVFFPGGIRIITRYKNETPVSETVYENNVKKRERTL